MTSPPMYQRLPTAKEGARATPLARKQGLLSRSPADCPSLLAGLFETQAEADAFRENIRHGRSASR